jgi:uncharacterized protein (DUF488 family)
MTFYSPVIVEQTVNIGNQQIWTLGHSTHEWPAFVALLQGAKIEAIADVRRFPASRRHPQFNGAAMQMALADVDIAYHHFEALGGRRHRSAANSPNTAWRVEAFNAYADHTASPEFQAAVNELESLAKTKRSAIMCAEALPWQCHRRVLADVLIARGWEVFDIFPDGKVKPHALTEFARIEGERVTYPGIFGGE